MSKRIYTADEARGLLEGTTPGPWVNKLGPHAIPIVRGPTYDVAFTFYEDAGAGNDKADADAALLAAAPDLAASVIAQAEKIADLLAIIEGAQGHLSNVHALDCEHPDTGRCSGCDVEKARVALAKAGAQ